MELLKCTGIDFVGKNAVVLGRSNIVGLPIASLLQAADATVTICHSKSTNIDKIVKIFSQATVYIPTIIHIDTNCGYCSSGCWKGQSSTRVLVKTWSSCYRCWH